MAYSVSARSSCAQICSTVHATHAVPRSTSLRLSQGKLARSSICRLPGNAHRARQLIIRNSAGSEALVAPAPSKGRLDASKAFAVEVQEGERPLAKYVTLPAEKYSVLDSDAVQRVGDNTFRVSGGQQQFIMGQSGTPVGLIQIEVGEAQVTQRLLEANIENAKGKAMAEVNRLMGQVQMSTTVSVMSNPETDAKMIRCEVALTGDFTEGVMTKMPTDKMNGLVERALGVVVPWFLKQLKEDYYLWVDGNEEQRGKLGKGQMKTMTSGMFNTLKTGVLPEGVVEVK